MRIPRPDLDALIWLTGYEESTSGNRMHAVRGAEVYCGHAGPVEVHRLLWIDRNSISSEHQATECDGCSQLDHRRTGTGSDVLVAIYGARRSDADNDLLRHIRELEQSVFPDNDYRIDNARTEFSDGFGSFVTYWRRQVPSSADQ